MKSQKHVVEAFAAAWAAIDGKLEAFEREKASKEMGTGTYLGYIAEAEELLTRVRNRLPGITIHDEARP